MRRSTRGMTHGTSIGKYSVASGACTFFRASAWPVEVLVVTTNRTAGSRRRSSSMKENATPSSPTLTAWIQTGRPGAASRAASAGA